MTKTEVTIRFLNAEVTLNMMRGIGESDEDLESRAIDVLVGIIENGSVSVWVVDEFTRGNAIRIVEE